MNHPLQTSRALAALALGACAISFGPAAQASVIFDYQGSQLTYNAAPQGGLPNPYGNHMTGRVTFDDSVTANFTGFVEAFTATMATDKITQGATVTGWFSFLNGAIVDYSLQSLGLDFGLRIGMYTVPIDSSSSGDRLFPFTGAFVIGGAYSMQAGTWTREGGTPSAVPLPATLPLLAAGLSLLGLRRRRAD